MSVTAKERFSGKRSDSALLAREYAKRRRLRRSVARKRADDRVLRPVDKKKLEETAPKVTSLKKARGVAVAFVYLLAALLIHGSVVVGVSLSSRENKGRGGGSRDIREKVAVRMISPPKMPAEPVSPKVPTVEEVTTPEAKKVALPVRKKKAKTKLFAKVGKNRTQLAPNAGLAADPVDLSPAPSPEQKSSTRRRVVGISFESTVRSGSGASFAVGNTRMGETGDRAEDPDRVEKVRGEAIRVGSPENVGPNRVAAAIPLNEKQLTKPKRITEIALRYPKMLKEQGIEGNVVVLIRISADGSVKRVRVLKSSGYPEFDDAATRAAGRERFTPAKKNGEPIDYSLTYTYRFRIKQA